MHETTAADITQYLKTMRFKRALFGVSREDVLYKIRDLNSMYVNMMEVHAERRSLEQDSDDKVQALIKSFVQIQEQSEGIVAQAEKERDEILAKAKADAEEILRKGREQLSLLDLKRRKEFMEFEALKQATVEYLLHAKDTLDDLVTAKNEDEREEILSKFEGF